MIFFCSNVWWPSRSVNIDLCPKLSWWNGVTNKSEYSFGLINTITTPTPSPRSVAKVCTYTQHAHTQAELELFMESTIYIIAVCWNSLTGMTRISLFHTFSIPSAYVLAVRGVMSSAVIIVAKFFRNSPASTNDGLTHWGRDRMADVSQTTFPNAFSWMKSVVILFEFHWGLFPGVQLTISEHWFR